MYNTAQKVKIKHGVNNIMDWRLAADSAVFIF